MRNVRQLAILALQASLDRLKAIWISLQLARCRWRSISSIRSEVHLPESLIRAIQNARPQHLALGQIGERLAEKQLALQGMRTICRSYRSDYGEIDLIALVGSTIAFAEVKARKISPGDHPTDAIDRAKELRIAKSAMQFLKSKKLNHAACRYDVVAIQFDFESRMAFVEHYEAAFESPLED